MKKFLKKAIKHPGRIKRALGVPADKEIPASKMGRLREMAKKGGSLGAAARLAIRFKRGEFSK